MSGETTSPESRTAALEGVRGAPDWLPPDSAGFDAVEAGFVRVVRLAGYERIRTPVFEHTEVFARGVGGSTDIVQKEMYTFEDKGGRSLTLRPEGTAGVMRAALEHHLPKQGNLPAKLWYAGSFYRHERPQAGRQREFVQVGIEALGSEDPLLDAEVVVVGWDALAAVGAPQVRLLVNTMGHAGPDCRAAYVERLRTFLDGIDEQLCRECRRRKETNPLRVFDCKEEGCQAAIAEAPLLPDHVCDACRTHHATVLAGLDDSGVPFEETPRLVRGLDYYTRTTFEYQSGVLGAQAAVGGGGRYDGLAEELGGERFTGIGFALGVDRTLLALRTADAALDAERRVETFIVAVGDARPAGFALATELRRAGLACDLAFDGKSFKAGMRQADRSGAATAVILGEQELAAGTVTVKHLGTGEQREVTRDAVLDAVRSPADDIPD
ncbi:MAG: histidine--tRNA ligase [Nitriliruptorales bacterium]